MLWETNEVIIFIVLIASFLGIIEFAFRLGLRGAHDAEDRTRGHLGTLQGAVLGLLALLLGFTFAMAASRFDARKALVVEEANAIGTASLRAQLLPPPQRDQAAHLFKEYVGVRLDFYDARIDPVRLDAAYASATRIQGQLWGLAVAAAARDALGANRAIHRFPEHGHR